MNGHPATHSDAVGAVWGTGGRRFKSGRPDQIFRTKQPSRGEQATLAGYLGHTVIALALDVHRVGRPTRVRPPLVVL